MLLHGENWQALNLIQEMYRGRIKCVYIDPPYNTGPSEILYKNDLKHSSWLSLMENRLMLTPAFLEEDGVLVVAIDDIELSRLSMLLEQTFPSHNVQKAVVNHYPGPGSGRGNISRTHEYAIFVLPAETDILKGATREAGYRKRTFERRGPGENNRRTGRPNSFYAILVDKENQEIKGIEPPPLLGADYPTEKTDEGWVRIYPVNDQGVEFVWSLSYESAVRDWGKGLLKCASRGCSITRLVENKERKFLTSVWLNKKFIAATHGTGMLTKLFGGSDKFPYPKSVYTVSTAIDASSPDDNDVYVLDYFAGSGTTAHAVINLNREDCGLRKFILAEVGDHFDTVLLPRVKKIIYSPEWKNGQPLRQATAEELEYGPRLVKYQRIESYEDTLANIKFAPPDETKQGELKMAEHFAKIAPRYELEWESRGCATRLSELGLDSPFSYGLELAGDGDGNGGKTRTEAADLPETFAYLAGLRVRTRRVVMDGARRYLVQRGLCEGRETAVIWRDVAGWKQAAYDKEADFIEKSGMTAGADLILMNGNSSLPRAESLNPKFGDAMFSAGEEE